MPNSSPLRIRYMSDLHLEFSDYFPKLIEADVIVLAGDIGTGTEGLGWAARTFAGTPVIYVPGNHEFYKEDYASLIVELTEHAKRLGIYFLNNQEVVIKGVRFLGSTLWTDFLLRGSPTPAIRFAAQNMNDYKFIRYGNRNLCPHDTRTLHRQGREFLEACLNTAFSGKTVVISHHAPSSRSLPENRANSKSAPAYASQLDDLAELADLWIHGHTHQRQDYQIGRCRVVCNPRGYHDSFNQQITGFDECALISV